MIVCIKFKKSIVFLPWRGRDADDFREELGSFQRRQATDHAGDGVADVDAGLDVELFQDGEQVVGVAVEG